jgi:hypothetical protein
MPTIRITNATEFTEFSDKGPTEDVRTTDKIERQSGRNEMVIRQMSTVYKG